MSIFSNVRMSTRNLGLWFVATFCILRSVEVLWLQAKLPLIQYSIAAAAVYYFVLYFSAQKWGGRISKLAIQVAVLFFLIFLATFLQVLAFENLKDEIGRFSHSFLIQNSIVVTTWFFAGASAVFCNQRLSRAYAILLLGILVFLVLIATGFGFVIPYSSFEEDGSFEVMNHLLLAEYMVFVGFLGYAASPNRFVKILTFFAFSYVMFSGGGRSSFLIGLFSMLVYEFLFGDKKFFFISVSFFLLALVLLFSQLDFSDPAVQRMLMADGLEKDGSYEGRYEQFQVGIENLWRQILFGDISLYVIKFNHLGNYMHNFLSVWQYYGLVVFLLLGYLVFESCRRMKKIMDSRCFFWIDAYFSIFLIYSVFSVLVSKYVGFGAFWYAIGYWLLRGRAARS